ncbi:hypothetical protein BT63DRAFT_176149 [Microthyrium microscopicum]|uniref:Uncharacterized protein n=1 Tax=Microthyrium microscopicum TaxID=703497 RepID=A0A6A6UL75_9PEZI|nr:hypothetical protein BT63DRAFT_176149 [Microthyrium microscopicum]
MQEEMTEKIEARLMAKLKPQLKNEVNDEVKRDLRTEFAQTIPPPQLDAKSRQELIGTVTASVTQNVLKDLYPRIKSDVKQELKTELKQEIVQELKPDVTQEVAQRSEEQFKPALLQKIDDIVRTAVTSVVASAISNLSIPDEQTIRADITSAIKDLNIPTEETIHTGIASAVESAISGLYIPTTERIKAIYQANFKADVEFLKIPTRETIRSSVESAITDLNVPTEETIRTIVESAIKVTRIPAEESIRAGVTHATTSTNVPTEESIRASIASAISDLNIPTDQTIRTIATSAVNDLNVPNTESIREVFRSYVQDTLIGLINTKVLPIIIAEGNQTIDKNLHKQVTEEVRSHPENLRSDVLALQDADGTPALWNAINPTVQAAVREQLANGNTSGLLSKEEIFEHIRESSNRLSAEFQESTSKLSGKFADFHEQVDNNFQQYQSIMKLWAEEMDQLKKQSEKATTLEATLSRAASVVSSNAEQSATAQLGARIKSVERNVKSLHEAHQSQETKLDKLQSDHIESARLNKNNVRIAEANDKNFSEQIKDYALQAEAQRNMLSGLQVRFNNLTTDKLFQAMLAYLRDSNQAHVDPAQLAEHARIIAAYSQKIQQQYEPVRRRMEAMETHPQRINHIEGEVKRLSSLFSSQQSGPTPSPNATPPLTLSPHIASPASLPRATASPQVRARLNSPHMPSRLSGSLPPSNPHTGNPYTTHPQSAPARE